MAHDNSSNSSGVWDVRRRLVIPALTRKADASALHSALVSLDGVKGVITDIARSMLEVRYDASITDYRTVVTLLDERGFSPRRSWWSNLKGSWYQFLDSNARDNAHLPPPSCCNKPPRKR